MPLTGVGIGRAVPSAGDGVRGLCLPGGASGVPGVEVTAVEVTAVAAVGTAVETAANVVEMDTIEVPAAGTIGAVAAACSAAGVAGMPDACPVPLSPGRSGLALGAGACMAPASGTGGCIR